MKKKYLLMPLCLSLSIFGAEKKSAWTKPLQKEPSRTIASSCQKDQSEKIDFLKEKVISLMDAKKEEDVQRIAFIELHQEYVNHAQATIIGLNNKVKEQKATIEQLQFQQPEVTYQEEIIALKATLEEQKATIEQLKLQQPVPTRKEPSANLKRRLSM